MRRKSCRDLSGFGGQLKTNLAELKYVGRPQLDDLSCPLSSGLHNGQPVVDVPIDDAPPNVVLDSFNGDLNEMIGRLFNRGGSGYLNAFHQMGE